MAPEAYRSDQRGRRTRIRPAALRVVITTCSLLIMVGCALLPSGQAPTATPTTLPPAATPSATRSQGAAPSATTPTQQLSATPAPAATQPAATAGPPSPAPPPTGCPPPPAGWQPHVVQPTDTVYDLAALTGTTIEEIQRVNCLADPSLIYDGQVLYIPGASIEAPATTAPAPPTAAPVAPTAAPATAIPCTTFNCPPDDELPDLELAVGGPDDAAFIPCQFQRFNEDDPVPVPYIDTPVNFLMERGQRRYFYVCDLPTEATAATVALSDDSVQQVDLLKANPNPDLAPGQAQAIVDWPSLPTQPLGDYTLTIFYGDGKSLQQVFRVLQSSRPYILSVPTSGSPGTAFRVYYVNFDQGTSPTFDFYGEDQPQIGTKHTLSHRDRWQIPILELLDGQEGKGWAQQELSSGPDDRAAAYTISYEFNSVFTTIWLR